MQRKFKISVDGHAYEVVVEEIAGEGGTARVAGFGRRGVGGGGGAARPPRPGFDRASRRALATRSRRSPAPFNRST